MKRGLSVAIAALSLAIAQDANAADMAVKALPVKAPAAVVIAPSWAGWYAGIAGGGGWGRAEQSDASPFNSGRFDINGALAGGSIGYNWQSGAAVFGIESDLSYAAIKGSTVGTDPFYGNCGAAYCATDIRALGTVRGRVGLAWNNLLPYVTGGFAYANVHGEEGNGGPAAFGSGSKWIAGWTLGAGLEARIAPNWSAKLEYLYAQLDGDVFNSNVFGVFYSQNMQITAQVLRVGINYHF